jgi:putative transposase
MRQRPRDTAPGVRHIVVGAASPERYYRDDVDHLAWTRRLAALLDRHEWTCLIVCELPTHVHLLVDIPNETLPTGMHWLSSEYGKDYNARHERVGALVRERYWSRRVDSDSDLLGAYAYVALNPVAAGLVASPEEWRWSSYATTLGSASTFPWVDATLVLSQLGPSPAASIAALRAYLIQTGGPRTLEACTPTSTGWAPLYESTTAVRSRSRRRLARAAR